MSLYRGSGGAGDSTTDASINEVTQQALNAANSATAASDSATTASGHAGTATTKASEAATSAGTATTQAGTATTQAGTATTKAQEAAASAAQLTGLTATASTLSVGSSATAGYTVGTGVLALGIPTGATGAQGIQGATGNTGIQGNTGTQGIQGIQGIQGVQGETGATYTHPANHAISVITGLQTALNNKLSLAGGAMTGAITTNSTFDGRNVASDGVVLDAAPVTYDPIGASVAMAIALGG